jgi:serine/threonine protein kinase
VASSTTLSPGFVFAGDYRVLSPLSQGGMGAVYVAEQLSTGKKRALKVMLPELVQDARLRERFEQEARVGGRISSEHIVEVVAAGVDRATGIPWLAMELLDGDNLGKWRAQTAAVSVSDIHAILGELSHAVGAAHAVGIVHRDLKPENVFIAQSKRLGSPFMVKVLDFGIAKLVDEARSTKTAAVGTPLWMSPEQTEASSDVHPASDVWAIGLIAFWLFTGKTYWRGGNMESVSLSVLMREVVLDPLVSASQRAQELGLAHVIPPGFDAWFARAVHRDPRARFPDARSAFAALEPVLKAASTGATMVSAPAQPLSQQYTQPPMVTPPQGGFAAAPYGPAGPIPQKKGLGCWVWGIIIGSLTTLVGVGA